MTVKCQIGCPSLVVSPPNRRSYNKYFVFFPSIYSPRASRLDHKSMGKNSVRSLQYGPKGRWKELEVNRGYSSHTWLNVAIAGAGRRPLFLLSSGIVSPTLYGCSLLEILSMFNTLIYYCFLESAINLLRYWSPNVVVTDNNPHPSPLLLVNSKTRLEQQHIMESLTLRDSIASRGWRRWLKVSISPFEVSKTLKKPFGAKCVKQYCRLLRLRKLSRSFGGPGDDNRLLGGLISPQKATSLNPD